MEGRGATTPGRTRQKSQAQAHSNVEWAGDIQIRGQKYTWDLEANIQAQGDVNSGAAAMMATDSVNRYIIPPELNLRTQVAAGSTHIVVATNEANMIALPTMWCHRLVHNVTVTRMRHMAWTATQGGMCQ